MNTLSIGVMSGTSMDGIDAALIDTDGQHQIKFIGSHFLPYDNPFQILLKIAEYSVKKDRGNLKLSSVQFEHDIHEFLYTELGISESDIQREYATLQAYLQKPLTLDNIITKSTEEHAHCILALLKKLKISASAISVIGYHGQNLFHDPSIKKTIQIGNAKLFTTLTDISVIHNFRTADVLAGGQGAPFAPLYHFALCMQDNIVPALVLNCGGITNASLIVDRNEENIIGFDIGPGNALIDRYVRLITQGKLHMDYNGKLGLKGKVSEDILDLLLKQSIQQQGENFLKRSPPKSLDTSHLNLLPELHTLSLEDACRTLEAFTAEAIVQSIAFLPYLPRQWIVAGGGFKNPVILSELIERLHINYPNIKVISADEIGWRSQSLEAELFAYLATRHLKQFPTSYPNMTNASRPTIGGCLHKMTKQISVC